MSDDGKPRTDDARMGESIGTMNQAVSSRHLGLWVIGVYKLAKAVTLSVGCLIVLRLEPNELVARLLRLLARLRLDPDDRIIQSAIARISGLNQRRLEEIGAALALYGLLYLIEGIGLLLQKRWAESLVIVMTSLLIPVEIFEVYQKVSWLRVAVLLINVLIVAYLIRTIRADRRGRNGRGAESASSLPEGPPKSSQELQGP